ncbi:MULTISPECIES: DUF6555 family protein [Pseudomonas]|uniref:Uncharacterized protein n=1 Tax=Pseudomonas asplenii TaxID=53407 RepID=A0A0N0E4N2_9PSED|nr:MULTISPECIES: DUF6555 family protein [Pseudomonas]KPA91446.1 hypothetical protein PF66_02329 [Pseudomonas fuscovaginae]KPA99183.1 hypothetical protein PF70_00664 [Pseudomonas fuscovaginae]
MNNQLFIIEYFLHGEQKSFIIRAPTMNNAEAWHWACCDAGIGRIPRFARERVKRISKPLAERYGVENVKWWRSGEAPFVPKPYIPPPPD